ncbi:MAG: 16S rRNA (guanine(527)-N(7))-methyltransferase RsmG, partial [Aquiluna sp.]
ALDKLLRLLTPLIRFSNHKTVIVLKGSKAPDEIAAASKKLELLGYSQPEILTLGSNKAPETATVVRTMLK